MTANAIILRKDFQRSRSRCLAQIRKGKIRAQLEDERRTERVVNTLLEKVDFYNWDESKREETTEIVIAVVREWGKNGMPVDEIVRRFNIVLTAGVMRIMLKRGELETKRDSYGRMFYPET